MLRPDRDVSQGSTDDVEKIEDGERDAEESEGDGEDCEGSVAGSERDIGDDERAALVTIARGAVVTSGGVSAHRVLTTATEFILARGLGPLAYGVYALAWRISQLLVRVVTFGSVPTLQRFLPSTNDSSEQSRLTGLAYATTVAFGALIALLVWLTAPWINDHTVSHPDFPLTLGLFGTLVGLVGLLMVTAAIFRAIGSARGEVLFNKLLRPGARLVGAVVALSLGFSVVGVTGTIVVCTVAFVVVGVPVSIRVTGIAPTLRGIRGEVRRFYNHAGPVAMSSLGKIFQNRIDLIMVGAMLTAVSAGVYNVVLVLVSIAWIPLRSYNQLLPPVASDLYSSGRIDVLNHVYTSVTRQVVTAVLPFLALFAVFGEQLLGVFGSTYTAGYEPLLVYLGGVFVGHAVGATGWLLIMTDHQYARMALDWLLATLNIVLTYLFVRQFGLVGAALGTSLAIAVQNSLQVLLLRRFEGLWPFDRTFLTPLGAGAVMAAVMLTARYALSGVPAVAVGVIVGVLAYVGSLLVLGVDPRDRLVVDELVARYRSVLVDWL
jgi:O-antigen/teichoic acid export membrane protein